MPTEAEPWQTVDVSEVEDKFSKMSTTPVEAKAEAPPSPPAPQEEVDFGSEPEEVALKTPLVSTASALPTATSSGQDSTMADATLPADSTVTPSVPSAEVNPKPKGAPEVKSPPATKAAAKAPPPGAQARMEDLLKLKPFLRIAQDEDSDVAAATAKMAGFTPPPRSASLPKSALKPRSKSRAASRPPSKGPERQNTPKRGSMSPPRQPEPQEQPKRKKTVGAISSSYFTGYTPSDINPAPRYQFDEMPRDLYAKFWKKDFLAWTLRDLKRSWGVPL